ncbi:MAG: hypothetical protein CM1200mP20_07220 [Pseudomonadota bacterium]|nr:MAG: hypothetical protein CM1200mP20_07220 [Pseudomonadota bacterium]
MIVRFDRKKALNAFDQQLIQELTEKPRTVWRKGLSIRSVVLAGSRTANSLQASI